MASGRMSVYSSGAIILLLEAVPGASTSGRISRAADAYMTIMDYEIAAIRWTKQEWRAVLDALADCCPNWRFVSAFVSESPELGRTWGVDIEQLAAEIRTMPIARKFALYEAAGRFWARSDLDPDEAMDASGIKPIAEPRRPF